MRWEFERPLVRAKKNLLPALRDLFSDIGSAFYELFVQYPKDIKRFVKNVWAYRELLWQDRDWDHAYILRMLQFKIRLTKEHVADHKHHTRWKLDVKNMQKAEDMIEAILEDNHAKELYDAHNAKWGPAKYTSVPVPGSSSSYMRTLRPNVHTPAQQLQHDAEYSVLIKKSIKLEQQAWSKLWKHLDKNLRSWWC